MGFNSFLYFSRSRSRSAINAAEASFSLPRRGELLRQAIQHAEYGFNAVAGEERQRRCPERGDGIGIAAGAGEKADRHSKHRAEHETYDVIAQIAWGKKTILDAAQIAPQTRKSLNRAGP
jgi:hypothetical protein